MDREMNVLEITQAFIKRYKIVLGIVLLFGFLGGGASFLLAEQEYQSTANLIVGAETQRETEQINPINGEPIYETVIQYGNSAISEQSQMFYSETLQREDLLREVIDELQLDLLPTELKEMIKLEVPENSGSLYISVNSSQYKEVDQIVNQIVKVFIEKVYEITEIENIKVLDDASEPRLVSSINYVKNILIAVVIGLVLSFVLVLLLEYFDDSIESAKDVESKLDLRVIGELKSKEDLIENIKEVRTNLEYSDTLKNKKNILLAGVNQNYPEISVSLAKVLKASEKETLLIDADFRTPSIHNNLELLNDLGLSDLLDRDLDVSEISQQSESNFQVLTAGNSLENPSEKLASKKMQQLLKDIQNSFDYILINGHAINEVTDSVVLSTATDGVILLVKENETKVKDLKEIKKRFYNININILGVILKSYE